MKRMLLKTLAFSIAVAVTSSLAACKPKIETNNADSNEPVNLKVWVNYDASGTSGVHDNQIMNDLQKRLGVKVDFEFNLTQETYNAKLAIGELPDVILAWNRDLKPLIDGKRVIDMVPLLNEHGKDILKETPEKLEFSKKFFSNGENKLYFIPTWNHDIEYKRTKTIDAGTGIGMYVRWDIYKEIGYPELKNSALEEIIPILKQMQEKHPVNAEGKKVYGLSPWLGDWELWNFTVLTQGLMNVDAEREKFIDIELKDVGYMKSQIGDTTSTLWQGARFLNKTNQAGVLDPESLTQRFDQAIDKQNSGRVLMGFTNWQVRGANATFKGAGTPEKGFMELKLPSNITVTNQGFSLPYADRWSYGITTKAKNPEKAMEFINFVNSSEGMRLLLNGIGGTHWKVASDGVPRMLPEVGKMLETNPIKQLGDEGFGLYTNLYGRSYDIYDSKYKSPADFRLNADWKEKVQNSPLYQDYIKHYNVEYPDQVFEKTLTGNNIRADGTYISMTEPTPTEIREIDDKLMIYLKGAIIKAVLAKNDAEFEAEQKRIIEDCRNIGYEKAYEWHRNNYMNARNKALEFKQGLKK